MQTVGILTRIEKLNGRSIHYIPSDIYNKLSKKVKCIIIPFNDETHIEDILYQIKLCNGIILPGGDDVYNLELDLCRYLYKENIPTLGICLGMQTMACAFGGSLSTLPNNNHKVLEGYVHDVIIDSNSNLFNILQENKILVNSRHKDYVLNTDLNIAAKSLDGIIEAVEDSSKTFFLGVQWHPENLNDISTIKIFECFINML